MNEMNVKLGNSGIPAMTDPMGRYWGPQPSPDDIVLDDTHALMTEETFNSLREYSGSVPSGVYPGKMWRRHQGSYLPAAYARGEIREKPPEPTWLLCWYGEEVSGRCPILYRQIVIADDVKDFEAMDWYKTSDGKVVATGLLPWSISSPGEVHGKILRIGGKLHTVIAADLLLHCGPWRRGEPCGLAVTPR